MRSGLASQHDPPALNGVIIDHGRMLAHAEMIGRIPNRF
jgi:hypothetical protein